MTLLQLTRISTPTLLLLTLLSHTSPSSPIVSRKPPYRNHGASILRRCRRSPNGGARGGLLRVDLHLHDGGHVGRAADAGGNLSARSGGEDVPAIVDGEVGGRVHRDDAHRGAQGAFLCVQAGTISPRLFVVEACPCVLDNTNGRPLVGVELV